MSIKIITGFDVKKKASIDSRQIVADQVTRLALTYYYKGLKTWQTDTSKFYEYVGDETTNLVADWRQIVTIHRGTAAPGASLGYIDDIFIDETARIYYLKTGVATWTAQFTFDGSQILISATDPPDNGDGENGDLSIYSNGKLWKKVAGVWAFQFSIAGVDGADGDIYATTSVTSVNLATATAPLSITVGLGLAYTVGQEVEVVSAAVPGDNLTGTVVSYNTGTGVLVLTSLAITGVGTHTDWVVNLSGSPGKQGKAFTHNEHDITLTQAKITAIVAGGYTPDNAWNASILTDSRSPSELVATANIQGTMVDHSISYDGVRWWDNGLWRGRKGDKGDIGNTGGPGGIGAAGTNAIVREYHINNNLNYTIPTEVVAGNYEIFVNYLSSTTGTPIVKLPKQVAGFNYRVFITLSSNNITARQISVAIDVTGSNIVGILKSDGSIYIGHNMAISNGSIRKTAIFYLGRQTLQNSFWILDEVSSTKIVSGGAFSKPSATMNVYSQTTARFFPASSYPSINMFNKQFVRPRIFFNVEAIRNTSDDDDINLTIQRSTSSSFAAGTITNIKVNTYRISSWICCPIEIIDELVPKSIVYYRLYVQAPSTAILTTDYDVQIHMVPYDVE